MSLREKKSTKKLHNYCYSIKVHIAFRLHIKHFSSSFLIFSDLEQTFKVTKILYEFQFSRSSAAEDEATIADCESDGTTRWIRKAVQIGQDSQGVRSKMSSHVYGDLVLLSANDNWRTV